MLTRAMGVKDTVEPDVCELPVFKGDIIVISSDGLSDKVSPEEILALVRDEKVEKACRSLVNLANERGGDDNVTVIVLKVKKNSKGRVVGSGFRFARTGCFHFLNKLQTRGCCNADVYT